MHGGGQRTHGVRAKSDTIYHYSTNPQLVVKHFIHGNCYLVTTPSLTRTSVPGEPNCCDVICMETQLAGGERMWMNTIKVRDIRVSFMLTWQAWWHWKLRRLGFKPDLCHHVRAKSDTIHHCSTNPQLVVKHFIHGNIIWFQHMDRVEKDVDELKS